MNKLCVVGMASFFVFVFFVSAHAQVVESGNTPIDLAENGYYPPDYPAGPKMMTDKDFGGGYRHNAYMMFGGMGVSLMWLLHFSIIIWLGVGILLFLFLWGKVFKK